MKRIESFLSELNTLDIKLWVENDRLRYDAPKGVITKPLLAELVERKQDIIKFLGQANRSIKTGHAETPIPQLPRTQKLPLSFSQQRLWFLDQLEKNHNAATYNMPPMVMRFCGPLNLDALQHSLTAIINRHEVLRTTFAIDNGIPVQVIAEQVIADLHLVKFQNITQQEQQIEIQRATRTQAETPFNLATGPLLRTVLLQFDSNVHVFILAMHHIISDGWSIGIMVKELSLLYNAHANADPLALPALPAMPIQYADFAAWQRQTLTGEFLEKLLAYWTTKLQGAPALLELPLDKPRPSIQNFQGNTNYFYLTPEFSKQINQFSQTCGVTLFMTLITAFATLLSRYTGQDDIVIGTPVAGRTHSQTESLIGFFINNLVLRIDLQGNPSFAGLLQNFKNLAMDAFEHQDLPFEHLVEALQLERNLSYTPIFQVLFVLQNAPMTEIELADITITPLPTENINSVYDLILSVEELPGGIEGKFKYNTDLFNDNTITKLTEHFQILLAGIIDNPQQTLRQLPLLTATDRDQLLQWNNTAKPYPTHQCLHQLFEAQVERTPDQIAVVFEHQSMSYYELNQKANRLANYLQTLGVQPEVLVGICMQRASEMVVGLLAILKAGGAYIPIDPDYPQQRLHFMLDDANVKVLLTQSALANKLHKITTTATIVCLDVLVATATPGDDANLDSGVGPTNLAYVIYTSGSTGQPKGAMNSHSAICNRLLWMQDAYQLSTTDNILQKTPFSFDVSVWEFFWPLLAGARLTLAKPDGHKDSDYLVQLIIQENITTLHFVPTMLQIFLQDPNLHACQSLKRIICSGEALAIEHQEQFFNRLPSVQLHNLYGPTEAAVDVTYWHCRPDTTHSRVPIGIPIANIQIHILDTDLQPVPIGACGELHIGGIGVARGYHNRPALTAEKFIRDPFSSNTTARLYKTGDLARFLADGNIDYLGRIDNQVKIRGFRIELGEIETILLQHHNVSASVVIGQQQAVGTRLLAYVVGSANAPLTASELRQFSHTKLPDYMVPAAFIMLAKLPITPNGKLDRKALPLPETDRPDLDTTFIAPETAVECLLADLWIELLEIEKIGIHDNFFELGGDSIKGAIFVNRLQEKLGKVVYVIALFEAPTIAKFIEYLDKHYPEVFAKIGGKATSAAANAPTARLDEHDLQRFRSLITPLQPMPVQQKNPSAVFVLSPPRSGSTLLRVLLGGHPLLFAPPELELLAFNTLAERQQAFTGNYKFYLEGVLRAIMEIKDCNPVEAAAIMRTCEQQNMTTQQFMGLFQSWLGNKMLVDKTPSYALDLNILKNAELFFDDVHYIHLLRHPYGMINSFTDAKLDQVFFREAHDFSTGAIAELIWLHSHNNILEFLKTIPPTRQQTIRFETLTAEPKTVITGICEFLHIGFDDNMLKPYQDKKQRMTDGLYPVSKMLGDVKFHTYKNIDNQTSERWRKNYTVDFLGDPTWKVAESMGYQPIAARHTSSAIAAPLAPITSIPRTGVLPLSFAQHRLWFLNQLEGSSATYNIPIAIRLDGSLNPDVLQRCLQTLTLRHESLRCYFPTVDGMPTVSISATEFRLEHVDLCMLTLAQQQHDVQHQINTDAGLPFDLETGPLFRARLLKLADTCHVLLLNMHHIIADGWSIGILIQEWTALYQAFADGMEMPLAPLAIQYIDFANWQRQWLQGERLQHHLDYWRQQLFGAPQLLELPTDFPRPALQRFRGENAYFELAGQQTKQLQQISQKSGTTLFMTLLSAFAILLYRYSGQEDIVIGSPIANRTNSLTEPLIGFFVNTLVLRLDLHDNPMFSELLAKTRRVALDAYAHQDIPFEHLVEELQPTRSLSYSPLYQVMFVMQNTPMAALAIPGLDITPLKQDDIMAKFDLTMIIEENEHGLQGTVEFNTELFAKTTIAQLIGHFKCLISSLAAAPEQPINQLPLLTPPEQQQLLQNWKNSDHPYPSEQTIATLFATQAEQTPNAIALIFHDQQISYAALNAQANQLAHYLQTLGVSTETLVALCVERSASMVVALLGILKAGGVYIPLDPTYPDERLAFMLHDCGANFLVTETHLTAQLPQTIAVQTICLDSEAPQIAQMRQTTPPCPAKPHNLAYIIYTSGSTGKPKGVMISHQAVVNFLYSMRIQPGINATDKLLAVTTISFDIAVLELYLPISVGATIVLADTATAKDGTQLLELIEREQITVMQATPTTWRLLLASGWDNTPQLTQLKALCGGEALAPSLSAQICTKTKALWNMYGPTETTVWSAIHAIHTASPTTNTVEPLGYPIANTEILILDQANNPVPIGVPGELHIGGDGLARGYLNRSELTAAKFITHPWDGTARLYKTGDRARYLSNGTIAYLGRMDQQVKMRGFRIELGEIEAVLASHPAILENAVTIYIDEHNDQHLAAYLVGKEHAEFDSTTLRAFLKQHVPDYMLPTLWTTLTKMPVTPNGKINRQALPAPQPKTQNTAHASLPRDAMELQLTSIWENVLNINAIGIHDDFFDLGGHSLIAVRLMAKIAQQFAQNLPLTTLFQGPTIAQLANIIRTNTASSSWPSLVPISPQGSQPPFFCAAGAGGNVLYFHELARHLPADYPFYGLQPQGLDGDSPPDKRVEDIAAGYITAIQAIQPHGPYYLGGHSFGGLVAFEMTMQLQCRGEQVAFLALIDTPAPHYHLPTGTDWDDASWLVQIGNIIGHLMDHNLNVTYATLASLSPEDQLNHLHERLKQVDFLPSQADIKHFRGFVEVYKANLQMRYTAPSTPITTPITLFRSRDEQPHALQSDSAKEIRAAKEMGWRQFSAQTVDVHVISGDHLTMMRWPNVASLAERLVEYINK